MTEETPDKPKRGKPKGHGKNRGPLTKAEREERQMLAFRYWMDEKKELREIAGIMNVSHETVRTDIKAVLKTRATEFEEDVRQWKVTQLNQLFRQFEMFDAMATDETLKNVERIKAGQHTLNLLKEINDIVGIKAPIKVTEVSDNISVAKRVVKELVAKGGKLEEEVQWVAAEYGVLESDLLDSK